VSRPSGERDKKQQNRTEAQAGKRGIGRSEKEGGQRRSTSEEKNKDEGVIINKIATRPRIIRSSRRRVASKGRIKKNIEERGFNKADGKVLTA